MSEFVQIVTTTPTREEAERIAAELVSRRLAACVQVGGPIVSTYRWQGNVETATEWSCTVKTTGERAAAIEAAVKAVHSYAVPEVVVTPIVGGSEAYLTWLREQVGE